MSTASPLPLPTPPPATLLTEQQRLRLEVTARLQQHRRRRGNGTPASTPAPTDTAWPSREPNRIASSVAARFANTPSYRDFLQQEAEAATRQAEAAAEVARRSADAIAAAQQQLLDEIAAWDRTTFPQGTPATGSAAVLAMPAPVSPTPLTTAPAPPTLVASASSVLAPSELAPAVLASAEAAPSQAPAEFSVLAPSEALRDRTTVAEAANALLADTGVALSAGDVLATETPFGAQLAEAATTASLQPASPQHVSLANTLSPAATAPAAVIPQPLSAQQPRFAAEPAATSFHFAAEPAPVFTLPAEPLEPPTPIPANLIEFPRQLVAAHKARPRIAEGPLREDFDAAPEGAQLRIFEVETSSFSTAVAEPESALPEWSSIRLDSWTAPHDTVQPDAQVSLALPVYAAPLERRVMAALVDGTCIGTAFVLAVAAAAVAGDALPSGLLAAGAAAVTLLLFGLGYLLLCFTLSGQTVGMRYARIALCTFGDDNPTRSAMRRRLLATALSAGSLGLGFAWALLDDDGLGWHDRISRMYQRAY